MPVTLHTHSGSSVPRIKKKYIYRVIGREVFILSANAKCYVYCTPDSTLNSEHTAVQSIINVCLITIIVTENKAAG